MINKVGYNRTLKVDHLTSKYLFEKQQAGLPCPVSGGVGAASAEFSDRL